MFVYYFLTIASLLGVAHLTLIEFYTYEIPTDYPIEKYNESIYLMMNSTTAATTYSMATNSKVLSFDVLNNYGKEFKLDFIFNTFNLSLTEDYCRLNKQTKLLDANVISVTIDFENSEVKCNSHLYLLNGVVADNTNRSVFFKVKFTSSTNIIVAFPNSDIMFPQQATTTESASPSSSTASYPAKKGLSNLIIIIVIVSSVAFFVLVIAFAVTIFILKRFGRLCFKKRKPRPAYLPDSDQEVVGVPSTYTCPIYRKRQKRSVSVDTIKTVESAEKVPSKIKLYRDGEYANIKFESTMTAIPKENTVV
uniref:Fgf-3 n=1 Tax=Panagrellus redivivus TaxID=6233 RepID=A0A7E4VGI5_PANRE